MEIFSNYVLLIISVFILDICIAGKCVKQSPCLCTINEYSFVSLSQVYPDKGSKETFFQDGKEDVFYFFSGCEDKDFDPKTYKLIDNHTISGVSLVKCISQQIPVNETLSNKSWINQTCNPIGFSKDLKFDLAPSTTNEYQIIFMNSSSNGSLPSIRLACDTYNTTNLKILSSDTDALILYSPLVCIQHIEHHELSTGSIFCIIFFVAGIVYFVGGGLLMYFARGARGVEVIPNFDFWVSIPGLMKDGMVYILSGCRPFAVSTAETYDRI